MKISIHKFILPSIPFTALLIGGCFALWALSYITVDLFEIFPQKTPDFSTIDKLIAANLLISDLLSVIITILNAFILIQLSTKFSLIRVRTFLQGLIFILLISVWSTANISVAYHLALTLILISFFRFLSMYRDTQAVEHAFVGSLFIGLSSFLFVPAILLLPAFWIGFVLFQSFSLRTFSASLIGAIVPWIIYFAVRYYFHPDVSWLNDIFSKFDTTFMLGKPPAHKLIYISLLFIFLLIGFTGFFNNLHSDSIQTRRRLKLFVIVFFASSILAVLFSGFSQAFFPLIALCYAMIISHPLTLQKSNFNSIAFILFCVINISYVMLNYFISIR
ncbi:MAG: DUF6427 family protein [Paludibacter sp.]|nr:DUF6427 family protein [Paludibacter sp.]